VIKTSSLHLLYFKTLSPADLQIRLSAMIYQEQGPTSLYSVQRCERNWRGPDAISDGLQEIRNYIGCWWRAAELRAELRCTDFRRRGTDGHWQSHNFAESLTATQLCSKLIYTLHVLSPTLAKTVHKFSHWQKLQLLQVYNDNLTSTQSPPSLLLMCCIMLTYWEEHSDRTTQTEHKQNVP
jgi:hypothetical protein